MYIKGVIFFSHFFSKIYLVFSWFCLLVGGYSLAIPFFLPLAIAFNYSSYGLDIATSK